jgi:hypothetical protein
MWESSFILCIVRPSDDAHAKVDVLPGTWTLPVKEASWVRVDIDRLILGFGTSMSPAGQRSSEEVHRRTTTSSLRRSSKLGLMSLLTGESIEMNKVREQVQGLSG